jgi:hypothetical protein
MLDKERLSVQNELNQLSTRVDSLCRYLLSSESDRKPKDERNRLKKQCYHMARYRALLQERLRCWPDHE